MKCIITVSCHYLSYELVFLIHVWFILHHYFLLLSHAPTHLIVVWRSERGIYDGSQSWAINSGPPTLPLDPKARWTFMV